MATSMNNSEVTAQIIWMRQDIRQLLQDNALDVAELRRPVFKMVGKDCHGYCLERLYLKISKSKEIFPYYGNREYNK